MAYTVAELHHKSSQAATFMLSSIPPYSWHFLVINFDRLCFFLFLSHFVSGCLRIRLRKHERTSNHRGFRPWVGPRPQLLGTVALRSPGVNWVHIVIIFCDPSKFENHGSSLDTCSSSAVFYGDTVTTHTLNCICPVLCIFYSSSINPCSKRNPLQTILSFSMTELLCFGSFYWKISVFTIQIHFGNARVLCVYRNMYGALNSCDAYMFDIELFQNGKEHISADTNVWGHFILAGTDI